eukprot:11862969-Alexandrium_andersonii.AAC.1
MGAQRRQKPEAARSQFDSGSTVALPPASPPPQARDVWDRPLAEAEGGEEDPLGGRRGTGGQ